MSGQEFGSVFDGVVVLLGGIYLIIVGWPMWRSPDKLVPGSLIYTRLLAEWQAGSYYYRIDKEWLPEKRIKNYGIRCVVGGILFLLLGIALIFGLL